jgi:predicted DsbA family dithiol-disulfide isomerase/uncharacterized membrane protein
VAVATSAALLVDYLSYSPAFCSPNSGCSAVRASGYGYLFNGLVPVPAIGIAGFGFLFFMSLSKAQRQWVRPIAYAGAAFAAVFIGLQAIVIKEYCKLCMIVDSAAILTAVAAYLSREKSAADRDEELLRGWAWIGLAAIALLAPLIWPKLQPQPPVPPSIQQFYKAGKINVVEFADFECPFCRALHPTLKKLMAQYGDRVNFVRLNMPLTRHAMAMGAAKAAVCAKAQDREAAMADAMFEAEDLSPKNLRRIALGLGVDADEFDACLTSEKTLDAIKKDGQILRDAGFQGLPTTYVGGREIVGAQAEDVFREAFEQAARGDKDAGVPASLYVVLVAIAMASVAHFGKSPKTKPQEKAPAKKRPSKAPPAKKKDDDDADEDRDEPAADSEA